MDQRDTDSQWSQIAVYLTDAVSPRACRQASVCSFAAASGASRQATEEQTFDCFPLSDNMYAYARKGQDGEGGA